MTLGFTPSVGTGVHPYSLQVTNWYGSTPKTTITSGYYVVVDRQTSPFGAGWWVAGLEQLNTSTMTLVDGGGGVRAYISAGTGRWAALYVDRPDTIVSSGSNYVRKLRGGGQVIFNSLGQHIETMNPQGHTTTFAYSSGILTTITLPAVSSPPSYTFNYTGGYLTGVTSPGSRTTTIGRSGAVVTSIQDPGSVAVSFASSSNRITSRTDRRGTVASFTYNTSTWRLSQASLDPTGLNIITSLTAAEGSGYGSGATAVSSSSLVDAHTVLNGPRTDVLDYTRFWVNPYGSPDSTRNALGALTRLRRGHSLFPAAVTSVVHPNAYVDSVVLNTRGNPTHMIRINPFAKSPAQNDTTLYVYYANTDARADLAHTIVPPERDTITMSYLSNGNLEWRRDRRGTSTEVHFRYYGGTSQLGAVQYPDGAIDSVAYDAVRGNVTYQRSPSGIVTRTYSDAIGRDTLTVVPINAAQDSFMTTRSTYNSRGLLEMTRTDGPARPYACSNCIGSYGEPVAAEYLEVDYTYDAEGNVLNVSRSGPGVQTTVYEYDRANRKTEEDNTGDEQGFSYDKAGNLTVWNRYGHSITSTYDEANRMVKRIIPGVFRPKANCSTGGERNSPCMIGLHFDSMQVRPDTQTFAYDSLGSMTAAHNRYARVKRTYFPGGALQTDSIRFRSYGNPDMGSGSSSEPPPECEDPECEDPEFAIGIIDGFETMGLTGDPYPDGEYTFAYGIGHTYDRNGRPKSLVYPSGIPGTTTSTVNYTYYNWGALQYVDGLMGSSVDRYTYTYDTSRRVRALTYPGSVVDSSFYDLEGNRVKRRVGSFYNDTLKYDVRGKVTHALVPSGMRETDFYYSGMGRLVASRWDNTINADFGVEEYRYDGHGSQTWSKRRDATLDQPARDHSYDAFGHLESIYYETYPSYPSGTNSFRDFEQGGDQTFGTEMHFTQSVGNTGMDASRYYYAADGKLRAVKKYTRTYDQWGIYQSAADVLQEMRYDALGRRITTHTRYEPDCGGPDCVKSLDRFIWNGDQLLVELRGPATNLDTQYSTDEQAGRVSYVQGPGIDAPLSVYRASFPGAATTRIIPFSDWRGQYTRGSFYGGATDCAVGGSPCISVDWPAPKLQSYLAGVDRPRGDWVGSLIHSHRDQSGLLYRRNRYYDPASGQFTQADPIGLAGGFNLHGYAAGDPVSYSDPFGLSPEDCCRYDGINTDRILADADRFAESSGTDKLTTLAVGGVATLAGTFVLASTSPFVAAASRAGWSFGPHKSATRWASNMEKRGWTRGQIDEAISRGQQFDAPNNVNPGNPALRYVHPETGRSVVRDEITRRILHIGGDGFKYGK